MKKLIFFWFALFILTSERASAIEVQLLPEFPVAGQEAWINSPPLHLKDLKGRVALLHFWTSSCFNCRRSIPWIKEMHKKYYSSNFVAIGVHTPRFEGEKSRDAVLDAIEYRGVEYPVFLDNDLIYWSSMRNRYWPTFIIVDKNGVIQAKVFGEIRPNDQRAHNMEKLIIELLKIGDEK